MRRNNWRGLLILLCVMPLFYSAAVAQDLAGLSTDETTILNRINASRLRENLVHLMPNAALNRIAETWVEDLAARPLDSLGDVYRTRSGQNIETLLQREGFQSYANDFAVDFIPIIVRDFGPSQIIDFWINDFRQPEPQLRTRRNIRFDDPQLPIFSALYREIGVAWKFNATTQRHYYTIIFAAQPNVLPVIAARRAAVAEIAQTFDQPEVVLYIHDERVNRFGQGQTMGAVEKIHISEQPGERDCADTSDPGWQPYNNEVIWTLSAGSGVKTIYVQMCDSTGRGVVSSTQVTYVDEASAPDISGVVRATQTAAAGATRIAPYQPTVEAILTATAAALVTPTPQ
ncbi:MAG: hypothetical protein K8J31_27895 [Anaerolineae bacterium]|nr:hypothetical protein [Anaerolineae bacterium]